MERGYFEWIEREADQERIEELIRNKERFSEHEAEIDDGSGDSEQGD